MGPIGLKLALIENYWLVVVVSTVTCKLGVAAGWDFYQSLVQTVIPYLRSLATDVIFRKLYYRDIRLFVHQQRLQCF